MSTTLPSRRARALAACPCRMCGPGAGRGPIFRDAILASAAIDRILHNVHVIIMEGDTHRNPPPGRPRPKALPKAV